ncbi:hypothetical protein M446_1665 [Methylobacterium sp. 4-46]|uniref:hypothetical protein n=1 Tax=unclassified Methylobacterium TaxID=2615210 RepID=UPI000152C8C8|nr:MULTISPECIES: hypothetical protein [Methylobacterium]ACA16158.1 hypothetical protein M446_1665 [Methylobacterium sp. 4-46]WFT81867.1 hypothetical protein QA634_08420 [Methylobacterium nodulans]
MSLHQLSETPELFITDEALDRIETFFRSVARMYEHRGMRASLQFVKEIYIVPAGDAPAKYPSKEEMGDPAACKAWLAEHTLKKINNVQVGVDFLDKSPWRNKITLRGFDLDLLTDTFDDEYVRTFNTIDLNGDGKLVLR